MNTAPIERAEPNFGNTLLKGTRTSGATRARNVADSKLTSVVRNAVAKYRKNPAAVNQIEANIRIAEIDVSHRRKVEAAIISRLINPYSIVNPMTIPRVTVNKPTVKAESETVV